MNFFCERNGYQVDEDMCIARQNQNFKKCKRCKKGKEVKEKRTISRRRTKGEQK